jgi:serine protease Do
MRVPDLESSGTRDAAAPTVPDRLSQEEKRSPMTQSMKRTLSIIGIVVASVAFGMILTADLGWMKQSAAQQRQQITTDQGTTVPAVTIPSFAAVADRVMPAVVSITTREIVRNDPRQRFLDPFDFFPDPRRAPRGEEEDEERQQLSGGSGFIISSDGYIITNNHVVEGATRIDVQLGDEDGRRYTAKVVGTDPATDLALIKIDTKDSLPVVKLGDSNNIRVGDWAIAIGNPLQFENTLTVGVISAKNRSLGISRATSSFENFIQTDAAINFGNSGGPLLNINGEAVGINTAIRGGGQNLGFAVPINVAKRILPQLREKGKVTRSYIGVSIQNVTQEDMEAFKLPNMRGALVEAVTPGRPAAKAGIQHGDVITRVDDQEVRQTRELIDYISDLAPGTPVRLEVIRDGRKVTLNARTEERPPDDADDEVESRPNGESEPARDKIGLTVQELTPNVSRVYGIPDTARGVVITHVKEVSAAGDAGLLEGDVVTEVNRERVSTPADFARFVTQARPGDYLRLYVTRYGRGGRSQSFFAIVRVPQQTQ